MNESSALNKKCPYSFNPELGDFLYCITSDCIGWHKENNEDGYCLRLVSGQCECAEKKTACDMDRHEKGAGIEAGEAEN